MKLLPKFNLLRPENLGEALELIQTHEGARPLAGGTDLLVMLRDGSIHTKHLIDLGLVNELKYIKEENGELRIGAMTTLNQILESKLIAEKAQALTEAIASLGSVQVRNRGTLSGNVCNASPAADTVPPLLVLDAKLSIASVEGSRSAPLRDLFAGPKMNSLKPNELLTEVKFNVLPPGSGTSFQKLGRRGGLTLSLVNSAAYLLVHDGICQDARLALGAVAPIPLLIQDIDDFLKGEQLSEKRIQEVAATCNRYIEPIDDIRASANYRREMSVVLARRVLMNAWKRARRI